MRKYYYYLHVVEGAFKGDKYPFDSIEEVDEFIVRTRKEGLGRMVLVNGMEIRYKRKVVGKR